MGASPPLDILVIEDDADARDNLRDILELDDHRVTMAGSAAEAMARDGLGKLRGDHSGPPAARRDGRAAHAPPQGRGPRRRRDRRDRICRPPGSDRRLAPGGDRLHPQAARTGLTSDQPAPDRRAPAARAGQGPQRGRVPSPGRGRRVPDRHPPARSHDHLLQPIRRGAHRILRRRSPGSGLPQLARAGARPARRRRGVRAGHRRRTTRGFQNPILCRDGSRRWIAWNARYLADYEDGPAILKVGQDITFLKQAQERALQAERLAAIGEVVAGLAHESRNALQRSQACLEMLALAVRDRPEALDLINRLQKAQDHLHRLYEDVRSYAAPIKLDKTSCDLGLIWRETWAHLESARKDKQAVFREVVDGVDLRCVADPFRLEQVFHNILDNALAATSPPVAVEVRAEDATLDGQPALRIAVRDNGPGIEPEQRPKVFDPFYTTKAKGTGLGMPIAKRIVEAHGGQIARRRRRRARCGLPHHIYREDTP